MTPPQAGAYGWIMLGAILLSAWFWHRRWKSSNPLLFGIFIGGLLGAFLGAKLVYILSEGWLHWGNDDFWLQIATGKTIAGALLGGYGGVEITKVLVGYREPTGDWFALFVPAGIAAGRIGCLKHGCCLGNVCSPDAWYALQDRAGEYRWPAVPAELVFNLLAIAVLFQLKRFPSLKGQLFHLYLMAYGLFRFFHEFARDTPRIIGGHVSGYQVAALCLFLLGAWRFRQRQLVARKGGRDSLADSPEMPQSHLQ